MMPFEAAELINKFPKNRRVPKQIYDLIQNSTGQTKKEFEQLIEGLYVLALEDEDFDLLNKYFR
tara:strand:+ start:4818 stop:5009 length:192 start_codon:yes stop_codon:yes gene_type:complete